jgi:outer membrane protein TolC
MQLERLKLLLNNPAYPVGGRTFIKASENLETPIAAADLERSLAAAQVWRPERRQADLAVRGGEIRQKYAGHNLWPRLDLVGRLKENDRRSDASIPGYEYDSLGRDWSVGLMLTVPLGNMKARAELARAESELAQSLEEKRNAEDVIAAEVKTAVKTLELIGLEIPVSQRAAEAAKRIVDGEWARFEMNQVGNRDLLQAQDLLALSERSRIQALARYNIALVRLLAAEGTLLEHLGVRMLPFM